MSVDDFVLVQGMRDTRGALERWNADPWPVLRAWAGGALIVASMLLLASGRSPRSRRPTSPCSESPG